MSLTCPRCNSAQTSTVWQGREAGVVVWTIHGCGACQFTWRDTEPERSIRYELRKNALRVDLNKQYPVVIPPRSNG